MQGLGQDTMLSLHTELGAGNLARSHPTCGCASCREALGGLLSVDALLFITPTFPIHSTDGPKLLSAVGMQKRWHMRLGAAAITIRSCSQLARGNYLGRRGSPRIWDLEKVLEKGSPEKGRWMRADKPAAGKGLTCKRCAPTSC